jgi:hypothetical protein
MLSKKHKATLADSSQALTDANNTTSGVAPVTTMTSAKTAKQNTTPSSLMNNHLDLEVIDDAFGKTADLYGDVLQVPTTATQEEIQLAYFDRRSELFTMLAKIDARPRSDALIAQRYKAERKMDSVVLAVRVLGDPTLRLSYDQLRPDRIQLHNKSGGSRASSSSRRQGNTKTKTTTTPSAAPVVVTPPMGSRLPPAFSSPAAEYPDAAVVAVSPIARERRKMKGEGTKTSISSVSSPPNKQASPQTSSGSAAATTPRKKVPVDDNLSGDNSPRRTMAVEAVASHRGKSGTHGVDDSSTMESRQEDDSRTMADTIDTASTAENDALETGAGVFSCITASRAFKKISDEISGACEDTLVSVDQVFNAFTLTEKDIKAVTKKIEKAKKQLDN